MTRWAVVLALSALAGCASAPWDEDARQPRARPAPEKTSFPGVVEKVREVVVETERTGVGGTVGAVIGGSVGSGVGRGRGAAVGAVVGTVLGGIAGEAAAQAATQPGLEITVRLDDGRIVTVTQPAGGSFEPGDRVTVVSEGAFARVVK
jgi:outer membrane lipoprotein SlyB